MLYNIHHVIENALIVSIFKRLGLWLSLIVMLSTVFGYARIANNIRERSLQHLQHYTQQQVQLQEQSLAELMSYLRITQQRLSHDLTLPLDINYFCQYLNTNIPVQAQQQPLMGIYLYTAQQTQTLFWQPQGTCQLRPLPAHLQAISIQSEPISWQLLNKKEIAAILPIENPHHPFTLIATLDVHHLLMADNRLSPYEVTPQLYNARGELLDSEATTTTRWHISPSIQTGIYWDVLHKNHVAVAYLPTLNSYLALSLSKTVVGTMAWETAQLFILFGLLMLTAVFILLYFSLTQQVAKPLHHMILAIKRLEQHDFTIRLKMKRQDELGMLAKSFDRMVRRLATDEQQLQAYARQLESAKESLECKVHERTLALESANREIQQLNHCLQVENQRMSAELAVTHRLQQMVLPKLHELKDIHELDIAVFMEPADEVGGDYYDVLSHNGSVKIGIGDVTGHGLESGVLMLMVQTAVRTLQANNVTDPTQFFTALNHTIYANIQRMNSDKTLTLSLLDYQDGNVRLSGQHEYVLWVNQNGQVDLIDTQQLGFIVGIEPEISQWINFKELFLQTGEGLVLYTDGITEATNPKRELYGLKRLCDVVSRHWHLATAQIQQAVINDVRQHIGVGRALDDITLVVMKRIPRPSRLPLYTETEDNLCDIIA
ncbi:serine phosphatase RsbU, regulator of sigma subunit [Beggiatoa alba B18LD]|uniref:Serine phosphatase RsbU, regulator of sigma subunit n=1 Tax=Beggiatoa alba B18LD TaxID=395493 RepID=I3CBJ0_9GAMM|nr:PP2C family protein-serine/threonine phosphatase [Beggiatoa alba]EIJ40983.1 serine phosphatase RsbU, regulator of sigma subunit [Beggiatoa alba B18LD]